MCQIRFFLNLLYACFLCISMHAACTEQLTFKPITDEEAREYYYQHTELHGLSSEVLTSKLKEITGKPFYCDILDNRKTIIALVHAGANPRVMHNSLLENFVKKNLLAEADYLLRRGVSPSDCTIFEAPIFFHANTREMWTLLKKYKIDLTLHSWYRNVLQHRIGTAEAMSFLFPDVDYLVNEPDGFGFPPLCIITRLLQAQILIKHGARRNYRLTTVGLASGLTAAQYAKKRSLSAGSERERKHLLELAAYLDSYQASTLSEMAARALLIYAQSDDATIAAQGQASVELLQIAGKMPVAYAAVLEQLSVRVQDDEASELVREQAKRDTAHLEILRRSGDMNCKIIADYEEEQRAPQASATEQMTYILPGGRVLHL